MTKISNFKTLAIRNLDIVWSLLLGAWNFNALDIYILFYLKNMLQSTYEVTFANPGVGKF